MGEYLNLILVILSAFLIFAVYRLSRELRKFQKKNSEISVVTDIEQIKSIGELSVFQVYSKEIVTKTDHAFGNFGKEYLRWLVSEKKLSMIFEFEINFIYDLTSPKLEIVQISNSNYKVKMPPCRYKFSIANMKFYDEKNGKFIPFLLPDSLNGFFGSSFREEDKNRLIEEARGEVEKMSVRLITQLQGKIHKSARDTLETIAKSFGANDVSFEFNDDESLINSELEVKNIA
ncbi:DUF4230 domain-containing protein [Campylobacter californiensis]|uniref:DUF4230 domain-containing protein n=1 Tax=Campylobacter californiensis TaxID=1032243 RepID=UPI001475CF71|nr:DUF4230 domain-containing protein [Campylobacter sp. RM12916]MBE3610552.1 DUF4230 domain-containing protein [Campylobacter sp. RM12916]